VAADDDRFESPTIEKVWLKLDARSQTAHLFSDYVKSRYGAFLASMSACGARRDERMRLPADLKQHRLCLRCSKIHERQERRREQDEENLRKHAEPARREP